MIGATTGLVQGVTLFLTYLGPLLIFVSAVVPSWQEVQSWNQTARQPAAMPETLAEHVIVDVTGRLTLGTCAAMIFTLLPGWLALITARWGGEFTRGIPPSWVGFLPLANLFSKKEDAGDLASKGTGHGIAWFVGSSLSVWAFFLAREGLWPSVWNEWTLCVAWYIGVACLGAMIDEQRLKLSWQHRTIGLILCFPPLGMFFCQMPLGSGHGTLPLPLYAQFLVYCSSLALLCLLHRSWLKGDKVR